MKIVAHPREVELKVEAMEIPARHVLVFDIETITGTWDNYGPRVRSSYLRPDQMVERDTMVCWAARVIGGKKFSAMLNTDELKGGADVRIAEKLWVEIDKADEVVGYNTDGFDIPWLQQILFGHTDLDLRKPKKSTDLFKIMKKNSSRSVSNSMRTVLEQAEAVTLKGEPPVGWAKKIKHEGDMKVLRKVLKYCRQDVEVTTHLYHMVAKAGWL